MNKYSLTGLYNTAAKRVRTRPMRPHTSVWQITWYQTSGLSCSSRHVLEKKAL